MDNNAILNDIKRKEIIDKLSKASNVVQGFLMLFLSIGTCITFTLIGYLIDERINILGSVFGLFFGCLIGLYLVQTVKTIFEWMAQSFIYTSEIISKIDKTT